MVEWGDIGSKEEVFEEIGVGDLLGQLVVNDLFGEEEDQNVGS